MPKFAKKPKPTPAISTASLPDIVFMLLFFFMVTTVMRESDLLVMQRMPKATQLQKLEKKTLVSYIYVGKPRDTNKYGGEPKIQVNDVLIEPKDIIQYVEEERNKRAENERDLITMSLKVDIDAKMGILNDVKLKLREANARKVNYSSTKRVVED